MLGRRQGGRGAVCTRPSLLWAGRGTGTRVIWAQRGRRPRGRAGAGTGRAPGRRGEAAGLLLVPCDAAGAPGPHPAAAGREMQVWEPLSPSRLRGPRSGRGDQGGFRSQRARTGAAASGSAPQGDLRARVLFPTFLRNRLSCSFTCCSGSSFRGRRPDSEPAGGVRLHQAPTASSRLSERDPGEATPKNPAGRGVSPPERRREAAGSWGPHARSRNPAGPEPQDTC